MKKSDLLSRAEWLFIIVLVSLILIKKAGITWFYIILYPVALLWLYNISRLIYTEWKEEVSVIKIWKRYWFNIIFYFLLICGLIEETVAFFVDL